MRRAARVSRLQRGERPGSEGRPPGRQQFGGHRLPGQHVPEPEGAAVHAEQLDLHPAFQRARTTPAASPVAAAAAASRTAARAARRCAAPAARRHSAPPAGPGRRRRTSPAPPAPPATPRPGTGPLGHRCTRAMTSPAAAGRHARTMVATWSPLAARGGRGAPAAAARPAPLPAEAGLVPAGGHAEDGLRSRLSLRYSRTASVSGSAQCRSSSTSSSPAGPASRRSSWRTASPRTAGGVVAVPVAPGGDRGKDRPQRRPPRRQPVIAGNGSPRSPCSRASVNGR